MFDVFHFVSLFFTLLPVDCLGNVGDLGEVCSFIGEENSFPKLETDLTRKLAIANRTCVSGKNCIE